MDQHLIDRIYECSFAPEFWPSVLDELAQIADARGGLLMAANTEVVNWTASAILREGMERFAKSDFLTRGQRAGRLCGARHAGFLTEYDLYTDEELGIRSTTNFFGLPALVGPQPRRFRCRPATRSIST
jgi:hypothetical protein